MFPPPYPPSPEDTGEYNARLAKLQADTPAILKSLGEAIRLNDELAVRRDLQQLGDLPTMSPLREAIAVDNAHLVAVILEHDPAVDEWAASLALSRKNRTVLETLLAFGWSINKPLNMGVLPLWADVDDLEFTQWLISHGADLHARSNLDESTLTVAIRSGSMDVVRFLMGQETDFSRSDLLHAAAQRENQEEGAELIGELVARGADVNAHQHNNHIARRQRYFFRLQTPLHIACREQNLLAARALLQHGADPYRKMLLQLEETEPTPFQIAFERANEQLVRWLVVPETLSL